jgi:hypothetical protein
MSNVLMTRTGKKNRTWVKTCLRTTLSTTNPTETAVGPATSRHSHGKTRAILRYGKGISFIGSPDPGESSLGPARPVQYFATPGSSLSLSLSLFPPVTEFYSESDPQTSVCPTLCCLLHIIFDPCTKVSMRNQDGKSPRKFVSSTTSNSQQHNPTLLLHLFLVQNIYY